MVEYHQLTAAENFFKNKEKYTVSNLLENHHWFDRFVHLLCGLGLDNASGGAFRDVSLNYYKDGVLLNSQHHSDDYCSIYIASNPTSKIILGCQDSRAYGDPFPRLSDGKWVCVWSWTDRKLKSGPWETKVREVIEYVIELATKKSMSLIEKNQQKLKDIALKKQKDEKELVNNWSNLTYT